MSPVVQAALDALIAGLVPTGTRPTGSLGYGRDLSCITDCDRLFSEVDPQSPDGIVQRVLRRLITPRGSLIGSALRGDPKLDRDARDYGLDLRSYLNHGVTEHDLGHLGVLVQQECEKEETVKAAHVELSLVAPNKLRLSIEIQPAPPTQAFRFVFVLTDTELLTEAMQ